MPIVGSPRAASWLPILRSMLVQPPEPERTTARALVSGGSAATSASGRAWRSLLRLGAFAAACLLRSANEAMAVRSWLFQASAAGSFAGGGITLEFGMFL